MRTTSLRPAIGASIAILFLAALATASAGERVDGHLAVSITEVEARSLTGGSEPFEVNRHWSATDTAAILVTGTVTVRWNNSIFASFAAVMDSVGKPLTLTLWGGEDDTTPNPVGFISQVWSDLYPEINDEEGLAFGLVKLQVPENGGSSSAKFELVFTHKSLAFNDDSSDVELVVHIPESGDNPDTIAGLRIAHDGAKFFLPSLDIDVVNRQLSEQEQTRQQEEPDYDGLR